MSEKLQICIAFCLDAGIIIIKTTAFWLEGKGSLSGNAYFYNGEYYTVIVGSL
jgi:hypothetical protein